MIIPTMARDIFPLSTHSETFDDARAFYFILLIIEFDVN